MLTNRKWLKVAIVQTLVVMLCAQMASAQGQRGQQRGQRQGGQRQGGRQGGQAFGGLFGGRGVTVSQVLSTLRRTEDKGLIAILKLTDSQKKKLDDLSTTRREGMRDRFAQLGNFRDQTEEERAKLMESFRKDGEKYTDGQLAVLNNKQRDALYGTAWQLQGTRALLDKKLQKLLELKKEQIAQIDKLLNPPRETQDRQSGAEAFRALRDLEGKAREDAIAKLRKDREDRQAKAAATRKKSEEKAEGVLNEDQQLAYLEATSSPELSKEQKDALTRRGGRQGGTRNRSGGNTGGRGNTNRGGGRSNRPSRPNSGDDQ
jgi:hypothetical protein